MLGETPGYMAANPILALGVLAGLAAGFLAVGTPLHLS